MKTVSWSEKYGSGFADLDAEHRTQVNLLRALHDALTDHGPGAHTAEILTRLADYTRIHFMSEQLLMRLYAYPHYDAHVREHDELVQCLDDLETRYAAGETAQALEAVEAMSDWLLGHVQGMDRGLGLYLEGRETPA